MRPQTRVSGKEIIATAALLWALTARPDGGAAYGAGTGLVLRDVKITAMPVRKAASDHYVLEWTISESSEESGALGFSAAPPPLARFSLSQNHPNPFNPQTTISFSVPGTAGGKQLVSLVIYDIRGRLVRRLIDADMDTGHHEVAWDGRDESLIRIPSGVYLYRLQTGGQTATRKMIAVK
jgi:hypothetical protein